MKCRVMGIVNVTPDSFSDGGQYFRPEEAIRRAKNVLAEGADILDLGGESTRPGATPIGWEEEWTRLEPVLKGIPPSFLSIDTYHPETAERAIRAGASMINCVVAEAVPEMIRVIEAASKPVELVIPASFDRAKIPSSIPYYIDPLIGFGTTREEDLEILKSISALAAEGRVLIGASRKRIVKKLTGEKTLGKDLAGNLTLAVWAALQGASIVRVHDVRETVQSFKVLKNLL